MSEQITVEIFEHLVGLAALQLEPDQAEYLRKQLNNQLKAIRELEAIPVSDDIPISLHGVPYEIEGSAAPREDAWEQYPDAADILSQAPRFEDGYIIVPDIPHTALE